MTDNKFSSHYDLIYQLVIDNKIDRLAFDKSGAAKLFIKPESNSETKNKGSVVNSPCDSQEDFSHSNANERKAMNNNKKLFIEKFLKGGAKCIPLVGGLIEEIIFGFKEDVETEKEQEKLHALIKDFVSNSDVQQENIAQILLKQSLQAGFNDKIFLKIEELINTLQSPPSDDEIIKDDTLPAMPRVFISHSSEDKPFVEKLANDLTEQGIYVWFDAKELAIGDSIVGEVFKAIDTSDYFIAVLSENSVNSEWVKAEQNIALMRKFSDKGISIIPIKIDDCTVPTPLTDILYADFATTDYSSAINAVIKVLLQEKEPVISEEEKHAAIEENQVSVTDISREKSESCPTILSELSIAELRRRLTNRTIRGEIDDFWHDTFDGSLMDDEMPGKSKGECVKQLIFRAKAKGITKNLLGYICADRPDIANP